MSSSLSDLRPLFRDIVVRSCKVFGASSDAMELLSCLENSGFDFNHCSEAAKEPHPLVTPRLISLLTSLAPWVFYRVALNKSNQWVRRIHSMSYNEISDAILIMLLIACDPASSAELRRQISNSIHTVVSRPIFEAAFVGSFTCIIGVARLTRFYRDFTCLRSSHELHDIGQQQRKPSCWVLFLPGARVRPGF